MTRNHDHHTLKRNATPPMRTPRLRLKAKAPQTGYVDGAWWPHSNALLTELPDLLAVLSVRLGPIDRVLYNMREWTTTSAKLIIGDRAVRLDGYRHQPPNSVEVLGLNRKKVTLLVVPPSSDSRDAHTTMMAAATPESVSTVGALLIKLRDREIQSQRAVADQERWDSEGGSPSGPTLVGLSGKSRR